MRNINTIEISYNHIQNSVLIFIIYLHLEVFSFIFLLIISKPLTFAIIALRLFIFFSRFFLSSPISLFMTMCLIQWFNYIYLLESKSGEVNQEENDYDKYKHKFYIISSAFVAGFATYFILDKSVNYLGDKLVESGLLSEESKKMIGEMQNVPFKFDVFCISFCIGAYAGYVVSQKLK